MRKPGEARQIQLEDLVGQVNSRQATLVPGEDTVAQQTITCEGRFFPIVISLDRTIWLLIVLLVFLTTTAVPVLLCSPPETIAFPPTSTVFSIT